MEKFKKIKNTTRDLVPVISSGYGGSTIKNKLGRDLNDLNTDLFRGFIHQPSDFFYNHYMMWLFPSTIGRKKLWGDNYLTNLHATIKLLMR